MTRPAAVKIRLNRTHALHGELNLPAVGLVRLKGENGSGKSSLLRALSGYRSFRGAIVIGGRRYTSLFSRPRLRQAVRYVSPVPSLAFQKKTLNDVLKGEKPSTDFLTLESQLHLPLNRGYGELSDGERAMFHLLYFLLFSPQILILDDLLSSLDSEKLGVVLDFLRRYSQSHLVLLCSQKPLADELFSTVIAIHCGQLVNEKRSTPSEEKPAVFAASPRRGKWRWSSPISSSPFLFVLLLSILGLSALCYGPRYAAYQKKMIESHRVMNSEESYGVGDWWQYETYFYLGHQRVIFELGHEVTISRGLLDLFPGPAAEQYQAAVQFFDDYFELTVEKVSSQEIANLAYYVTLSAEDLTRIQGLLTADGYYLSDDLSSLQEGAELHLKYGKEDLEAALAAYEAPLLVDAQIDSHKSDWREKTSYGGFYYIGTFDRAYGGLELVRAYTTAAAIAQYRTDQRFADSCGSGATGINIIHHLAEPERFIEHLPAFAEAKAACPSPLYLLLLLVPLSLIIISDLCRKDKATLEELALRNGTSLLLLAACKVAMEILSLLPTALLSVALALAAWFCGTPLLFFFAAMTLLLLIHLFLLFCWSAVYYRILLRRIR